MKKILLTLFILSCCSLLLANAKSPYMGQENRTLKALSEKEIQGYLEGKGLGFAKAAELNNYPGPRHVLDLSSKLSLTKDQALKTQSLFNSMQKQAIKYGEKLIEKEQQLDDEFANKSINKEKLETILTDISALKSKIRYVHLNAHLDQKALLNKHQVMMYDQLRGYGSKHSQGHNHSH